MVLITCTHFERHFKFLTSQQQLQLNNNGSNASSTPVTPHSTTTSTTPPPPQTTTTRKKRRFHTRSSSDNSTNSSPSVSSSPATPSQNGSSPSSLTNCNGYSTVFASLDAFLDPIINNVSSEDHHLVQHVCVHCQHSTRSKQEFEQHVTATTTTSSGCSDTTKTTTTTTKRRSSSSKTKQQQQQQQQQQHEYDDESHILSFCLKQKEFYCFACRDFIIFENDTVKSSYLPCLLAKQSVIYTSLLQQEQQQNGGALHVKDEKSADSEGKASRKRKLDVSNNNNNNSNTQEQRSVKIQRRDCEAHRVAVSNASSYSNSSVVGLRGLNNLGNTCFMNCVLQSLCHNPLVRNYFLGMVKPLKCIEQEEQRMNGNQSKTEITNRHVDIQLHRLICELYSGAIQPFNPNSFLYTMWNVAGHMAGYQQQDAHEFLMAILGAMSSHSSADPAALLKVNCVTSMVKDKNHKAHNNNGDQSSKNNNNNEHNSKNSNGGSYRNPIITQANNIVDLTFRGIFQSDIVCCSCGKTSTTYDPFLDISLQLKTSDSEELTSLAECLQRYTRKETLGKDVYSCEACKSKRQSTKQLTIRTLPHVLCLHLKRFAHGDGGESTTRKKSSNAKGNGKKITSFISFPVDLDMYPYTSEHLANSSGGTEKEEENKKFMYSLFSVVQHKGSMDTGHYTSYVKHNNRWFLCDDSMIFVATEEEVLTSQAYLLFYVRHELEYRSK